MILLDVSTEQEEQLREKALARGLTVEGYLLTLIDSLVSAEAPAHPRKLAYRRVLAMLMRKKRDAQAAQILNLDPVVRDSVRRMREVVLEYKEQAVEAVTKMNILRSAADRQERQSAEKAFQALRALTEQDRENAKCLWVEHTVLDKHLETVRLELAAATETAAAATRVFQKEEERVQARASKAQAGALEAYQTVSLTPAEIVSLVGSLHTDAEWDLAFEEWVLQTMQRLSASTREDDPPYEDPGAASDALP